VREREWSARNSTCYCTPDRFKICFTIESYFLQEKQSKETIS